MKVETAEESPNVVLGMFLVNSYPATILFDTGASHSFISAKFVEKHSINTSDMENAMLIKSPGGKMDSSAMCPGLSLKIRG